MTADQIVRNFAVSRPEAERLRSSDATFQPKSPQLRSDEKASSANN